MRQRLAEAEFERDMRRGEVTILRSNMSKSSQVFSTQLRDVRQTQNVENLEHEHEIDRIKSENESLRTEKAFVQNDLLVLRNSYLALEKKLLKAQEESTTHAGTSRGVITIPETENENEIEIENEGTESPGASQNKVMTSKVASPKKRIRSAIQDSFMDGFSMPPTSPSKKRRLDKFSSQKTPPMQNRQSHLLLIESSSERSTARFPQSPSPHNPVERLIDEGNELIMEELRSGFIKSWLAACNKQAILEFVDSVLSHNIVGALEPSLDYLSKFCVQVADMKAPKPISTILKASLLHEDTDADSPAIIVDMFSQTCITVLEQCLDQAKREPLLVQAIPSLLLLINLVIDFAPEIVVCKTMCVQVLNAFIRDNLESYSKDASESQANKGHSISLPAVYRSYSLLYSLDILDYIGCSAVNISASPHVWREIQHSTILRLLSPSIPSSILIKTVNFLITSFTHHSIGSLDHDLGATPPDTDPEIAKQKHAQQVKQEDELLKALSHLLIQSTKPSPFNVFSSIDNSVAFQYVPFSFFQNTSMNKNWLNSSFSIYSWFKNEDVTIARLEDLHRSQSVFLRRCVIKAFMMILSKRNPRLLVRNDSVLTAITHCLSFELDFVYDSIPLFGGASLQDSVALISDCVKLLHAMWALRPDSLTYITSLPGSTPHDHIVSLARILFSEPSIAVPADVAGSLDYEPSQKGNHYSSMGSSGYENPKASEVSFASDVTQKARDLLENTITFEDAEDLFASMSI